jgi:hypothetical protein
MKRVCLLFVMITLAGSASVRAADKAADDKAAEQKKDAPAKDDKDDNIVSPADVDRWVAFFDKFVGTIDADQNDCDKMAKDLDAHLDANQALLMKAKAASAAGKKLPPSAQQHMMATMQKMGPGVQKCGSNEKVGAVLRKIPR